MHSDGRSQAVANWQSSETLVRALSTLSLRSSLASLKSFRLTHSVDLSCKEVATEFSAWLGNTRLDRSDDQAYRLVL